MTEPGFLLLALVVGACAAAVLAGIRRWSPADDVPWRLAALALALFTLSGIAAAFGSPLAGGGCSPLALTLFAVAYLPFAAALLRLQLRAARAAAAIDAIVVTIAVTMIWWVLFGSRAGWRGAASCQDQFLGGVTPVSDVVLVVLAVRLLLDRGGQRATRLLAASAIVLPLLDLAALAVNASPLLLAGYGLAAIFVAAAALHPSMAMSVDRVEEPQPGASVARVLLLAAAGLVGPALLMAEHAGLVEIDDVFVETGTMLVFLLALLRIWLLNAQATSALQAAEASRDQLRLSLDAVQMAAWEWNSQRGTTVRTPGMAALYGTGPDLDLSTNQSIFASRIHPDDRAAYVAWEERISHRAGAHEIEHRVVLPDGGVRWLRDRANVVLDPNGRPSLIRGVTQDITDLKRTTAELRAAEHRLERLIAQLPAMVYIIEDGVLSAVTPDLVTQRFFGFDSATWAATWADRLHPDDREAVLAEARRTDATREPFLMEYRERTATGEWCVIRDESRWIEPQDGAPGYWLGMRFDVTSEAAARQALADAEARYRGLVEGLPAVVFLNDPQDNLKPVFISPQLEEMTGYRSEEWVAMQPGWFSRVHPEDRERVAAVVRESTLNGETMTIDYRLIRKDGRVIWVRDWSAPVLREDGERQYWQGFMLDVTAQVESEEALRAAWKAAEEANRLRSAFLSTISHELRTPMNGIIGYAGLLLSGLSGPLSPQQEEDVRQIAASGDHLLSLIDELLDQSRIESGRVEVSPEAVVLPDALEGVRSQLAPLASAAGLALAVEIAPGTPDAWADPGRLHQMLVNLAGNAIKFTHDGGVTLCAHPSGPGVEICVRDTGIGIAPQDLPLLFEPFWQADGGPNRRYGGAGLGLSITRRLAEAQGGRIAAESEPGVGSTFCLWLPAAPGA